MSRPVYGVVLAAGESSRLGRRKQLVTVGGESLVESVVRKVAEAGVDRVAVITGFAAGEISAALDGLDAVIVFNPEWRQGMGSSIAAGVRHAASADAEAALIALTDQPRIQREHYAELVRRYRMSGRPVATGYPDGTAGVPAIFPERFFGELAALSGEGGAKRILERSPGIEIVPNPLAALDIDLPGDLR